MFSLFLSVALASPGIMKADSYQVAFIQATSCPSDMMKIISNTSGSCIVNSRYVKEECFKIKNKVICNQVNECRIYLSCMGPK